MPTSERDRSILEHIVSYCCDIEDAVTRFGNNFLSFSTISPESADSGEILSVFGTFGSGLFLTFGADPNRDPYGEMSGNYWRAPERILPIVLAASFFAEVVT